MSIFTKIFGSANERELKRMRSIVAEINAWEPEVKKLSDEQLTARAKEIAAQIRAAAFDEDDEADQTQALFEAERQALPEVFALTREASVRALGMRPFDMQLVGGITLWEGRIAEMKTGEGKTLAATMPLVLHAMAGRGAHLVTVNDYLAKRDSEWMGAIYAMMGLTVGLVVHEVEPDERQASYRADITYGTNNEFGFDYLRDNLKIHASQLVQRPHHFAIVDEVDSILIDEARTPLIISGPVREDPSTLFKVRDVVRRLKKDDHYELDEKHRNVMLNDEGVTAVEHGLGVQNLFDDENADTLHKVENMLRAYALYNRDRHYIVKGREVILIDEHTGRTMIGRRLSEGLHQAIEAKENVQVRDESQTYATISLQNYFRMYKRLAGMTGTADTEATEFKKIYKLDVVVIPTNARMIRDDEPDKVYLTAGEKFAGVYLDILDCYMRGQPTLVGTTSIEMNELVSELLNNSRKDKRVRDILDRPIIERAYADYSQQLGREIDFKTFKIPHTVLNAKQHDAEALVVAQGGRFRAVTIATNMAGRGTDIKLGGDPEKLAFMEGLVSEGASRKQINSVVAERAKECAEEHIKVVELGGLRVIGTERHESRRIDNQLRGRSGRQGDPGSSSFYLSLEDDLLRIFGGRMEGILAKLQVEKDLPIVSHRMMDRAIERAQKSVEAHNFDIRKRLLEYDDVMNQQREVIYEIRRHIMIEGDVHEQILEMAAEVGGSTVMGYTATLGKPDAWDLPTLSRILKMRYGIDRTYDEEAAFHLNPETEAEAVSEEVRARLEKTFQVIRDVDAKRYSILEEGAPDREKLMAALVDQVAFHLAERCAVEGKHPIKWRYDELTETLDKEYGVALTVPEDARLTMSIEQLVINIQPRLHEALAKNRAATEKRIREVWEDIKKDKQRQLISLAEQRIYLWALDHHWMRHLWRMDHLREAVSFSGYAQRDPLLEYKREGFEMFDNTMWEIKKTTVNSLFRLGYDTRSGRIQIPDLRDASDDAKLIKEEASRAFQEGVAAAGNAAAPGERAKQAPIKRDRPKLGRNDPCYCGSGKKYKHCHWDQDHRAAT
jgi:preprotein translocase subunit SecA